MKIQNITKFVLIFSILCFLFSTAHSALLVDDCETGTSVNSMGGPSYTFDDGNIIHSDI